jgi:hypothetical protein
LAHGRRQAAEERALQANLPQRIEMLALNARFDGETAKPRQLRSRSPMATTQAIFAHGGVGYSMAAAIARIVNL